MSTTGIPLIRYIKDYDLESVVNRKKYLIEQTGSGHTELYVAYSTGHPTEFLTRETFEKLDDFREAYSIAGNP